MQANQTLEYDFCESLQSNPRAAGVPGNKGLEASQIDGAYPMMGPNAENIQRYIKRLQLTNWDGTVSIVCHGSDDNTRDSVKFMKKLVNGSQAGKNRRYAIGVAVVGSRSRMLAPASSCS